VNRTPGARLTGDETAYFDDRLARTPVPPGKVRRTVIVDLVVDVDKVWADNADYLANLATGIEGLLSPDDEIEDAPWLLRDITTYDTDPTVRYCHPATLAGAVYDACYTATESFELDDAIGSDLAYLMAAILKDAQVDLAADRAIVGILRATFPDPAHPVWRHVEIKGADDGD
jgi:hypothetical protein